MKKTLLFTLILLWSVSLFGCTSRSSEVQLKEEGQHNHSIVYKNTQYGFSFSLPECWKDYTIVTDKWEGFSLGGSESSKTVETGPIIYIRHPQWTSENPRQDIPIMIFTLTQWDSLQQEEFHIGAAPIGPSKLGHNTRYVFALPARYNYAFLTGYEEVENILKSNALQAIEERYPDNRCGSCHFADRYDCCLCRIGRGD